MEFFQLTLFITTLFCSLVAGLVFTFAIIVMPGIRKLEDLAYLQSFKAMDRVIQDNQPVFLLVWLGSVVTMFISTALGLWQLGGLDRIVLIVACLIFVLGVHLPTITINIPLNNRLQSLDLESMTTDELSRTKAAFEQRWLRWNSIRTILAIITTVLLIVLLMRL